MLYLFLGKNLEQIFEILNLSTPFKILTSRNLLTESLEIAKENLPSRVYSKDLIELLFHQPYTKVQFLVNAGIVKRHAAAEYLRRLEEIGVLSYHKVGKENLHLNKNYTASFPNNMSMLTTCL